MAASGAKEAQIQGAGRPLAASDADLLPGAIFSPGEAGRSPATAHLPPQRRRGLSLARAKVRESLNEEYAFGHLFHWLPVLLGTGAATWFALDAPLSVRPLLSIAIVAAVVWLLAGPWRPLLRAVALAFGLVAAGALLAAWETARKATVILDAPVTTMIRGVVLSRDVDAAGRLRYRIGLVETERPRLRRQPQIVRVTALAQARAIEPGQGIAGRARLSPPSGPALASLNDFAFNAYFEGIGAYGFFYGHPEPWTVPEGRRPESGWQALALQELDRLRQTISARIRAVLPGDTGAFAASMITDDRRAISKQTTEALREAGLSHVVAISGLNMALAAGLFFVGLRVMLSVSQSLSHRLPVKKIAAAGALATVTGYYLISGFAVSAERAYIMMAIMLAAAMAGRAAISLRNVSLSALVILVLSPSAVMGPGFQMSFAATLALVAGYNAWSRRRPATATPSTGIPLLRPLLPAWNFITGVFLTSLIGGLSTALFAVEHFHSLAAFGLPANLLAMPLISFIVMPMAVITMLLMPFGLDYLPLVIMGYGLDAVIAIAHWAASLDGDISVGRIPGWLFVGTTLGLLMLSVMRSRLRFLGAGLAASLMALYIVLPAERRPELVVFEDGRLVGLVTGKAIAVSEPRAQAFITDQWKAALGLSEVVRPDVTKDAFTRGSARRRLTTDEQEKGRVAMAAALHASDGHRFACLDGQWCAARLANFYRVIVAIHGGHAGAACDLADLVVTPARLSWQECRSGARLVTAETLRRTGSLEFHFDGEGAPKIVAALSGRHHAWTAHRFYDWRSGETRLPE